MFASVRRCVTITITAIAVATLSLVASAPAAQAVDPIQLPAGTACDFALRVDITENPHRVVRQFTDVNGNVVRTIESGKGNDLVFTNQDTGESLALKSNGSVMKSTPSKDAATRRVVATGHNVIILFPTDDPAGPSTILYTGRVVYDVTPDETFTLVSTSGNTRDICAELS